MKNIFSASRILALLIYFNKQGAVSKPLIKSDDEIASPFWGYALDSNARFFFNVQFCS